MIRGLHVVCVTIFLGLIVSQGAGADKYCCQCKDRSCETVCKSPGWCGGECGRVWCGTVGPCSNCSTHNYDGRHNHCENVASSPEESEIKSDDNGAVFVSLSRDQWVAFFGDLQERLGSRHQSHEAEILHISTQGEKHYCSCSCTDSSGTTHTKRIQCPEPKCGLCNCSNPSSPQISCG